MNTRPRKGYSGAAARQMAGRSGASSSAASSSKRGAKTKIQVAQEKAAIDDKQQSLKTLFQFGNSVASVRPPNVKPRALPFNRPKPRKFKTPMLGDSDKLEVQSVLNDVIADVMAAHKVTESEVQLECHNTLNTIIDRIELDAPKLSWSKTKLDSLRCKRQHYMNKTRQKLS